MKHLMGLGVKGYRSYGDEQRLERLSTVNFLAGQNNAGKTNTLSFLGEFLANPAQYQAAPGDQPIGLDYDGPLGWSMQMTVEGLGYRLSDNPDDSLLSNLQSVFVHPDYDGDSTDDSFWLTFDLDDDNVPEITFRGRPGNDPNDLRVRASANVFSWLGDSTTALSLRTNIVEIVSRANLTHPLKSVHSIASVRRFSDEDAGDRTVLDGRGLKTRLFEMQHPSWNRQHLKEDLDAINRILRELFEDETALLEISGGGPDAEIVLSTNGTALPLERHGLGIQQVAILATIITTTKDTVFLVEEPETNLHPSLQRRFSRILRPETGNQYFVATHSVHMLDAADSSVYHLQFRDHGTTVRDVSSSNGSYALCRDLGYRASDVLQINCVIWVEGPSDRIYLRHLLELEEDFEWKEGVHYTIMIYGGSLLSSLSASDPSVRAFITLPRINRNMAVVMDSDKKAAGSGISPAKSRVMEEFEEQDSPQCAWITWGYTFENYIPRETLTDAVKAVHPKLEFNWKGGRYSNPFTKVRVDKIAVAHRVCEKWSGESPADDLHRRVRSLVELVSSSNRF